MMNKESLDTACGRGIFALVLAILIFAPLAFGGVGAWEFLVVQALTIGVLALWAVRLWVSPKPQFLWPPIAWAALAFALYAVGRYLTADIEYAARLELIQVLVCTFLFLAILNNVYHQEMTQAISYTLIVLAMAASSYAMVQFLTHSTRVWYQFSPDVGRASGTFLSPDHFCAFLEMLLPLVLALILVGRVKPITRVLLGYSLLVMLGGVGVTFSRAGWASAVAGLLIVLLILIGHRNHRKFAALALGLLVAAGALCVTHLLSQTVTYSQRMLTNEGKINLDVFVRMKLWLAARQMWFDHFWWGVGPAHFDWRFNEYRPQAIQLRPGWVHCDYLNLVTDWGMVGGLIVLAGIILVLVGIGRTWGRVRSSEKDFGTGLSNRFAFFLGALGGLTALAVHSCVDFNLHVPADALLAATLLALLSSNLRFATERYWHKIRLPVKLTATFVLAAGMIYLGWQEFRLGHEAGRLLQAAKTPENTLDRAQALEAAFKYEPGNFENAYDIGECYRQSGMVDANPSAEMVSTAMQWYQTSLKLNPYYSLSYLRQGSCLDFLGRHDEAEKFYLAADQYDPNGYFTAANVGWHYALVRNFAAAQPWLVRSDELKPKNPIANQCLTVVNQEMIIDAGAFR
jgi:O-antigen ligase